MNLDQVPSQEDVVEHFDSPLRFHVKSRSRGGLTHTVDLGDSTYPHGYCTCRHFETTCGPAQKKGENRQCYHILRARSALTDWIIQVLKDQDANTPQ